VDHLREYKELAFDILKKSFSKFNFARFFTGQSPENLLFSNFAQGINLDRYYDLIPNERLQRYIQDALKEYNDNNAYMGLVLFEDAMKHVCRICRIVLPPSGHAMLVGVGGSGKQSLSKLSAFIMSYSTFQITISASYAVTDLKSDLQLLFFKCGLKDEQYLFLFTEGQISNEMFLV